MVIARIFNEKIRRLLNNLNNNKIETILFHDTKILFKKDGRKILII